MNNDYVIGLDIGTSSVKGVLTKKNETEELATARVGFQYDTDESGKVEISAEKYLEACFDALKQLSDKVPADGNLTAICAGAASGNIILLDKNHNPIAPIINWQDKRTKDEVTDVLGENFDYDAYYRSTGWAFDKATFPLASLCRLKKNSPGLLEKTSFLYMSTEYLIYRLTGTSGISTSAGTPFYLIDQKSGKYREDILSIFSFDDSSVPSVVPVGSVIGLVTSEAEKLCGVPAGTAVVAGAFDHPSAARGAGVTKPGELLLSCGTSWVGFFPVESRELAEDNKMLIDPFLSENGGCWAGMVSLASVAAEIEGYIRKYITNDGNIYKTFESYAEKSELGAGGLVVELNADDNENYIRSYPKEHIARAIMEGVIRMLKKDFERLENGGIKATRAVMVGGPTECPLWAKVISEMTGLDVTICHGSYAGAVGSSILASKAL